MCAQSVGGVTPLVSAGGRLPAMPSIIRHEQRIKTQPRSFGPAPDPLVT